MASKILEDDDYIKVYIEVSNEFNLLDFDFLREITELEEEKMSLGKRRGIYNQLKTIINNHLDKEGV